MLHIYSNFHSGSGRLRCLAVCHELRESHIPYRLHTPASPDALRQDFSSWHLTAEDTLLIIGGDGSVNQIVNLLPAKDSPSVILLPSGSGNDFARGIRMKKGDSAALRLLRRPGRPHPCLLDCGEAGILSAKTPSRGVPVSGKPRKFAVSCGIGYDADVCYAVNTGHLKTWMNRLHIGKLAYLLLGIQGIARYKEASGTLTLDGSRTLTFHQMAFLSCHNLPYEGGGFAFAPKADPRDGLLDICLITARSRLSFTLTLAASIFRLHTFLPNVHTYTCREAEIHTDIPLTFHTDGETCRNVTGFRIRTLPQRIPFLFEPGKD